MGTRAVPWHCAAVGPTLEKMFEALADLLDAHAEEVDEDLGPGEGNFRCTGCEGCFECRFCVGCRSCERCTYCEGCDSCVECTQCRNSCDLEQCSHSDHSRACARSSYLTLCFACEDCVQCFACVGLSGEEFCVLNEKRPRREYFELVGRLRAELESRAQDGFLPAFEDDPEAWFEALAGGSATAESGASTPMARPPTLVRSGGPSVTRGQKPARAKPQVEVPPRAPARSRLRTGRRPPRP